MSTRILHIDIAIIGGGIAGLWTLNQLRSLGYSAVLFEQGALGDGQSIGAQGIIHGGIKYALSGALNKASESIGAMPNRWRAALGGEDAVDLRGTRVLSEHFYLWSNTSLPARLRTFFADKLLRTRVQKLDAAAFPGPLQCAQFSGQVYRLDDFVLDMPSLIATLAAQQRDAIFAVNWESDSLENLGGQAALKLPECTVVPQRLLLTAGAGNEALIANLGGTGPAMQRRPLQQVMVLHEYTEPFFAHCLGTGLSPRITVSSHHTTAGEPVWYLGGDLATEGASAAPQQLIRKAQAELAELLPWVELGKARWHTLPLNRAEPRQPGLLRPDCAFVEPVQELSNVLAAWPTKLSLAPDLADKVQQHLEAAGIAACEQPDLSLLAHRAHPPLATSYWDRLPA